ncbi:MAG TPA: RNA polymerase sigma factor [Polyangia bacterium]|nr:RNA polymerase sigma factor [Polyangia bacterium]
MSDSDGQGREVDGGGDVSRAVIRLRGELYARALFLTRRKELADDLTQEACARALRARASYRRGTNVSAWLFRILNNAFIDDCRRRRNIVTLVPSAVPDSAVDPTAEDDPRPYEFLGRNDVLRCLKTLDDKDRRILHLALIQQRSYREIGSLLNLCQETVGTRIHRAKKVLRRRLESLDARRPANANAAARGRRRAA